MRINISAFDLNLLVVFDAVMSECSVSKAANRIGVSQPAVSNALNRLRGHFQDQLFVRTTDGVRPTEFAAEIASDVAEGLRHMQMVLEPRGETVSPHKFVISMSDQAMIAVLPRLLKVISASQDAIPLHIKTKRNATIQKELEAMEVDIAVGTVPDLSGRFDRTVLYHDKYVIMIAKNNPVASKGVSKKLFPKMEQVAVLPELLANSRIDRELKSLGTSRNIIMNVTQFQVLPNILRSTHLISLVPRSIIGEFDREFFCFQEIPFPVPEREILAVSHRTRNRNASIRWLHKALEEACKHNDVKSKDRVDWIAI